MRERVRVYLAPVGETLMLKLRHYARNARLYLSVTDNGVTLEYTQKISACHPSTSPRFVSCYICINHGTKPNRPGLV